MNSRWTEILPKRKVANCMSCACSQHQPIELDRKSITKRIRESGAIKSSLQIIDENLQLRLSLFRCPTCGQLWQSGHEWNFADEEYLFQVPATDVTEWKREPFAQPAAMMIYSTVMRDYFARASCEAGDSKCRADDCTQPALRFSVFCRDHHVEELQRLGKLPKKPVGKLFSPYYIETNRTI